MPKMLSVSTKTGDKGTSGLANGQRVSKDRLIFEVLGTQDEVNSWLGVCIALLPAQFQEEKDFLFQIQDTLFYIGAELAQSPKAKLTKDALNLLEKHSDSLQSKMEEGWTTKFLYPGGNQPAAFLDVARTVSRRLERLIVKYGTEAEVSPLILKYVNRLSDYLFVLRCFVNSQEKYQEKTFSYKTKVIEREK
jgi:cob(I)alamin adenosyltransferase